MRIKNLTNGPYELLDKDGKKVTLPARGTIEIEPHAMQAGMYKSIGYFEVSESDGRDDLRTKYHDLTGEHPDNRWGEKRLQDEIKALEIKQ